MMPAIYGERRNTISTKAFDLAAIIAARSFLSYEVSEKKNDQRDHHAKAERDVPWHTALFSRFPRMEHAGQRKG